MARFNYQAAREGGMSDAEILQFLDTERAAGNEYDIDPAAGRMLMVARSQMMEQESPEALAAPPWYADPVDLVGGINPARLLSRDIPRMAGAARGLLQRPFAKKAAEVGMDVATGGRTAGLRGLRGIFQLLRREPVEPPPMMPPNATAVPAPGVPMSSPPIPVYNLPEEGVEAAAPVITRSMRQPIRGGREAEAFRRGGQAELDILRRTADEQAAKAALAKRMGIAEPAPQPAAQIAPEPVAAPAAPKPIPEGKRLVREHLRSIPKPKTEPSLPASTQRRIAAAKPKPEAPKVTKSRHDVQYYSESQGKHINIEDMNQKHIEQAYRKLSATNPKKGSVAARQLDALMDESKHRLQTTGIHVGQTGLPKPVVKRIEMVKQAAKGRRSPALSEKAGAKAASSKDLSSLLKASVDLGAEMEKRGIHGAQRTEAYRLLREMSQ